jgi:hypothetical protein
MKMSMFVFILCIATVFAVSSFAQSIQNTRTLASYSTIQNAIDAASNGDTIAVAVGTYSLSTKLLLNKSISLLGADEASTIIDAHAVGIDWGIGIYVSNVSMSNFTLLPPVVAGQSGTANGGGYGVHSTNLISNIALSHITVQNGNRTGIDLNGATNVNLSFITSRNAAYGNGITLTGVVNAIVTHCTTSGNAWGGIAVYVSTSASRGSDQISIDGTCSFQETNAVYAQDELGYTSTNIAVAGYDYVIKNSFNSTSSGYTWYANQPTSADTIATVWSNLAFPGSSSFSLIRQSSTGTYYVGSGMSIRTALNAASAGDTVHIAAGNFSDTLILNKRLTLKGTVSGTTILTNLYPLHTAPLITVSGSGASSAFPLTIKDLNLFPQDSVNDNGIMFNNGVSVSYVNIDHVAFTGTSHTYPGLESGIYVDMDASVSNITINNCFFAQLAYGIVVNKASTSSSNFSNVTISNSTFTNNSSKGIYFEKLSNAVINACAFTNNGDITRAASWARDFCSALDINLKYGSYSNINVTNSSFTYSGIGSAYGTAVTVKARGTGNDPSYTSPSASLDGVTILGCTFNKNNESVRIGEAGKNNTGPTNVRVAKNTFVASTFGMMDERGSGADTIDAAGNWWNVPEGPNDNSGDGTTAYDTSTGDKLYETTDRKIAYAPWYIDNPDDDTVTVGVNQHGPKAFIVKGGVPFASKGYVNHGITLSSLVYADTIYVERTLTETPAIDHSVVLKFAAVPVLDSLVVSSGDLHISSTVTISGGLSLTNGNMVTDTNKVILDTNAVNPIETATGSIIGTVEIVPRQVGTGTLTLLGLDIQPGSDDLGKVSFVRKSGDDGIVSVVGSSSIAMTWQIEAEHQPSGGRTVTFSWLPQFDNTVDTSQVIVYRNEGAGWQYYAGPLSVSGTPRQVTVNATGFSTWTVGSVETPLSVELKSFAAVKNISGIIITWNTVSEINNFGFDIERRTLPQVEGRSEKGGWEKIGFVAGNGTSNTAHSYSYTDAGVSSGTFVYRLKQIDNNGIFKYSSEVEASVSVPKIFVLNQNYPNPFNPTTTITFTLAQDGLTTLKIYDVLGREVATLMNDNLKAGAVNTVTFNASMLSSGVYFSRLENHGNVQIKKLVLMK